MSIRSSLLHLCAPSPGDLDAPSIGIGISTVGAGGGTRGSWTFCLVKLVALRPDNLLLPPGEVQAQEMAKI